MDAVTAAAWRAAQGDALAMATFVRGTQGDVWRLCSHLVDRDSADDLTQEVYLRALPALADFRGDASARTWILAIARHTCTDELRRRIRGRALVERIIARSRPGVAPDPAAELTLEDLVVHLEPARRAAFVLTQVLGLTYAETAAVCGCEIGTVRSRVARARMDLVAGMADDAGLADGGGTTDPRR